MDAEQQAFRNWWTEVAQRDHAMVGPKAAEYGSNSLEQMGRKMAQLQGLEVTKEEALELGCWAYAIGKMERWTDAVMRGERPSIDTLIDLGVYVTMVRRIRQYGDWPGRREDNRAILEAPALHGGVIKLESVQRRPSEPEIVNTADNDREHAIPLPDPAPTGFIHITLTSDPGCQHKNVNVHTIQPEPDAEMGVGTCLDCGRKDVPVKNPRGYTQNGAHE